MTAEDLEKFLQNVEKSRICLERIAEILEDYYGKPDDKEFYFATYLIVPGNTEANLEFDVSPDWEIYARELYVDGHEDCLYSWQVASDRFDSNAVRFWKLKRIPTDVRTPKLNLKVQNTSASQITLTLYIMGVARSK